MRTIPHWINGQDVTPTSGNFGPVFNPALGEQQAQVGLATVSEMNSAIAIAKAAFPAWRATSLSKKAEIMFRFRELVVAHRDEIAGLVSIEHGKVPSDAAGELARGIENIEFACGIPSHMKGGFSEQVSGGVDVYSIKQPLGVVAGITPFNFPAMVPLWMLTNGIAAGNTFILKPSEKDPSVTVLLARLLTEAGLPDGVLNVVHGDKLAVDTLLEHPDIAAVSFVGSTPIAKYIYSTGTANGKRVQALGGAKNHMVVLPDADINMASTLRAATSAERLPHRISVSAWPIHSCRDESSGKRVGPGTDPSNEMGPLITQEHHNKVASYLAGAAAEGATVVIDGREGVLPEKGYFLNPSVIDHVRPGMKVYDEEIFGPVLSVIRVDTYEEAVELINDHQYGNGTAIFTRDGGAARQFQFDIQVGMVGINVPIPVPVAYYSFGGWKSSLFGDANMYGPAGIEFYTHTKTITSRWPDPATSSVDLGFPQNR